MPVSCRVQPPPGHRSPRWDLSITTDLIESETNGSSQVCIPRQSIFASDSQFITANGEQVRRVCVRGKGSKGLT